MTDADRLARFVAAGGSVPPGGFDAPDEAWAELPHALRDHDVAVIRFAGPCNNDCRWCANHDAGEGDFDRLAAAVRAAREPRILLAGREPTLHPRLRDLVALARDAAYADVAVLGNARRFAYRPYARALASAGLTRVVVKLVGPTEAIHDEVARCEGAWSQAMAGAREAAAAGVRVDLRFVVSREGIADLPRLLDVAADLRARRVELEIAGASLDGALSAACARIAGVIAMSRARGIDAVVA